MRNGITAKVASMKTLSLKLPDALSQELDRAAKESGQTKSDVTRQALECYLLGEKKPPAGSLLEALGEWAGCYDGPPDLSTNPKYMEGYGE
jgi:hypothetical protein